VIVQSQRGERVEEVKDIRSVRSEANDKKVAARRTMTRPGCEQVELKERSEDAKLKLIPA
jgi:hypothetical protein